MAEIKDLENNESVVAPKEDAIIGGVEQPTEPPAYILQDNPWKVWMSTNPQASAVLTNLYDLIFNEKDELRIDTDRLAAGDEDSGPDKKISGLNLGHDILIYNSALYSNVLGGKVNPSTAIKTYYQYGIDAAIGESDPRAKYREVETAIESTTQDKHTIITHYKLRLPDKDSILRPHTANAVWQSYYKSWMDGTHKRTSLRNALRGAQMANSPAYRCLPDTDNNLIQATFVVCNSDPVFEASLQLETNKSAYTQVALNVNDVDSAYNTTNNSSEYFPTTFGILDASLFNLISSATMNGEPVEKIPSSIFNGASIDNVRAFKRWMNGDLSSDPEDDPELKAQRRATNKDILKHCYIWIKAPFCADYVNPVDYNQDLHQDASVIHKNLYSHEISENYNRYREEIYPIDATDIHHDFTDETRGYIPKNAPLKDFVSQSIINEVIDKDKKRIEAKAEKQEVEPKYPDYTDPAVVTALLSENAGFEETTRIGGLLSEPSYTKDNKRTSLVPVQFFDKEKFYEQPELDKLNRVPTILPKDGNVYTDGRIISPTIDELWYVIKKLISGRPTDKTDINASEIDSDFSKPSTATNEKDFPRTTGDDITKENETNTLISEVLDANEYNFVVTNKKSGNIETDVTPKLGDPVNSKFIKDEDNNNNFLSMEVTDYFTQPDRVWYVNYSDVLDNEEIYKALQTNDRENPLVAEIDDDFSIPNSPRIIEEVIEGISTKFNKEHEDDPATRDNVSNKSDGASKWSNRPEPLSLREIEARILNNKFNLEKIYREFIYNGAKTGGLGLTFKEKNDELPEDDQYVTSTSGSLYYLHRDYNYKDKTPNTFYRFNGQGKHLSEDYDVTHERKAPEAGEGTDAVYADFEAMSEEEVREEKLLKVYGKSEVRQSPKKPLLRKNYGKSRFLRDNDDITYGDAVYLAANGTWKPRQEHARFPILRSDY